MGIGGPIGVPPAAETFWSVAAASSTEMYDIQWDGTPMLLRLSERPEPPATALLSLVYIV